MAEGISSCKKELDKLQLGSNLSTEENQAVYKEPSENSKFYGLESHFNEDVVFYKNVTIHGQINSNVIGRNTNLVLNQLSVVGLSSFGGPVDFYESIYVDGNVRAGIVTVRDKLDVGCGATILSADASTERVIVGAGVSVGIGSTIPQQALDVAGSVKIDATIYDSTNVPGENGYQLVRDERGVRWIPLIAEPVPGVPGIATDGIFVLNEGVPLYP